MQFSRSAAAKEVHGPRNNLGAMKLDMTMTQIQVLPPRRQPSLYFEPLVLTGRDYNPQADRGNSCTAEQALCLSKVALFSLRLWRVGRF